MLFLVILRQICLAFVCIEIFGFIYYYRDEQISVITLIIGEIACLFSLFLCFLPFPFFFLGPAIPLIIFYNFKKIEEKIKGKFIEKEDSAEIERISSIIERSSNPITLCQTYEKLGDIYFKKEEYEKAVENYKKAIEMRDKYDLKHFPELSFKLKMAEKEDKIKKGEIWVCPKCSFDNSGVYDRCKNCGYIKEVLKSVKLDIEKHKGEIKKSLKKDILLILGIYLFIIVLLQLLIRLPPIIIEWLALFLFLFAGYLIFRFILS